VGAGVAAYLCKPLHDELLLDAIANVMGRVGAPAGTEDHKRA
jgi:DNA-binding response OmpR family regulator